MTSRAYVTARAIWSGRIYPLSGANPSLIEPMGKTVLFGRYCSLPLCWRYIWVRHSFRQKFSPRQEVLGKGGSVILVWDIFFDQNVFTVCCVLRTGLNFKSKNNNRDWDLSELLAEYLTYYILLSSHVVQQQDKYTTFGNQAFITFPFGKSSFYCRLGTEKCAQLHFQTIHVLGKTLLSSLVNL